VASKTLLDSALNGGRTSRNGDLVIVTLPSQAFVTTAQEFMMVQQWARSKQSDGMPNRDRTALIERLETVIARNGSGIATRGNPKLLQRMVTSMEQLGMVLDEWMIPRNLGDDGMKPRKKAEAPGTDATEPDAEAKPQADA
jgi:hypothetical protein